MQIMYTGAEIQATEYLAMCILCVVLQCSRIKEGLHLWKMLSPRNANEAVCRSHNCCHCQVAMKMIIC